MKKIQFKLVAVLSIAWMLSMQVNAQSIQESHIEANLPATYEEFTKILEHDLTIYFSEKEEINVEIEYDLLRKQPTQSGIAYPKFYAWVKVLNNGKILTQGVVRVAAIDKIKIEVTNYVTSKNIIANPLVIDSIFPKMLCEDIKKRAGAIK